MTEREKDELWTTYLRELEQLNPRRLVLMALAELDTWRQL